MPPLLCGCKRPSHGLRQTGLACMPKVATTASACQHRSHMPCTLNFRSLCGIVHAWPGQFNRFFHSSCMYACEMSKQQLGSLRIHCCRASPERYCIAGAEDNGDCAAYLCQHEILGYPGDGVWGRGTWARGQPRWCKPAWHGLKHRGANVWPWHCCSRACPSY